MGLYAGLAVGIVFIMTVKPPNESRQRVMKRPGRARPLSTGRYAPSFRLSPAAAFASPTMILTTSSTLHHRFQPSRKEI